MIALRVRDPAARHEVAYLSERTTRLASASTSPLRMLALTSTMRPLAVMNTEHDRHFPIRGAEPAKATDPIKIEVEHLQTAGMLKLARRHGGRFFVYERATAAFSDTGFR